MLQYVQDYDEFYPPYVTGGGNRGWAQNIQPYLKSPQIFQCPSEPTSYVANFNSENAFFTFDGSNDQTDYFYNKRIGSRFVGGGVNVGIHQAALSNVALSIMSGDFKPSLQANSRLPHFSSTSQNGELCAGIIGVDNSDPHCANDIALNYQAAQRHLDGANYLFADGHVKFQKPTQLYGNATPFATSGGAPTFRVE